MQKRRLLGKLVTLICLAGPAWFFGVLSTVVMANGRLQNMEARGWIYLITMCAVAIVGVIQLFEIPVLRYRITVVEKEPVRRERE